MIPMVSAVRMVNWSKDKGLRGIVVPGVLNSAQEMEKQVLLSRSFQVR